MAWTPKPWLAVLLSLLLNPLGLLYVQRPLWGLLYFVASIVVAAADIYLLRFEWLTWLGVPIAIASAVHAYWFAKRFSAEGPRRFFSRAPFLIALPITVLAGLFCLRAFLYEPFRIPSASMFPSVPEGSYVVVAKPGFGSYRAFGIVVSDAAPTTMAARGDLVVFRLTENPETSYFSRVIGVPGDRIEYVDRHLRINGVAVPTTVGMTEDRFIHATELIDGREITIVFTEGVQSRPLDIVVPPDAYVVLGDNRDNARDSRFIGPVPRANVVGRVVKVFR